MRVAKDLARAIPIGCHQCLPQVERCVADTLEDIEKFPVAVDMSFCYLPIVGSGVSRLAGLNNDDPVLQRGNIDIKRLATHPIRRKMYAGDAAILG